MSKHDKVFNLLDSLLPSAGSVELAQPSQLQHLYAGIGMPSLRVMELSGPSCTSYFEIKAANPLRDLTEPNLIQHHYGQLREQALLGDEDALNDLGWWWLNGLQLKSDPALARRLFRLAAVTGSSEALFNLAEQTYYGKGGEASPALAIEFYEQAFEAGICCAARALGRLYEEGDQGVRPDHGEAIKWYKRGAAEQDVMACFLLGRLALDDSSIEFDEALGLYWLQWAAMSGLVLASERLVELYNSPVHSPPDPDGLLCRFWRELAVSQGSA